MRKFKQRLFKMDLKEILTDSKDREAMQIMMTARFAPRIEYFDALGEQVNFYGPYELEADEQFIGLIEEAPFVIGKRRKDDWSLIDKADVYFVIQELQGKPAGHPEVTGVITKLEDFFPSAWCRN